MMQPAMTWLPPPRPATRRHWLREAAAAAAALAAGWPAVAATAAAPGARPALRVGPGGDVPRLADALRLARDGDTLQVLPGVYAGEVAVITQRQLTIVGLGDEPPVFDADGRHAEGKAIWVVRDGDIRISNIAFRGCRVPSANGAGIRFERGRLQLARCRFTDNQMGLLTSNDERAELLVQQCEFSHAPDNPDALPHLLYVGRIGRLVLQDSRLHHGRVGHLLKCRARQALITGNWLDDGPQGRASYEIDLPNGGQAEVTHNLIGQGPGTENPVMLCYGAESDKQPHWPVNRLLVAHNRFVNRRPADGVAVRVFAERLPADTVVDCHDNQLLGGGALQLGPGGSSRNDAPGPLPAEPVPKA